MIFNQFSEKQLTVLNWWCPGSGRGSHDAIICDGAVRSGKTLCLSLSFIFWAFFRYTNESFAVCGKTIRSLRRNMISPLIPVLESMGFACSYKYSENLLEIEKDGRMNSFYIFGGRDESSASLIQGITLCGVLLDEVALMPRSFVEQALARCSREGSKFWFSCNPEHPGHWFYLEWIKKRAEKNALYLHFTMADNPSLSPEIIKRYDSLYSGVFHDRFIKGKWTAAEGLIYPMFDPDRHVRECAGECEKYYISCDYGTINPASFGLFGKYRGAWYRLGEYYYSSKREGVQLTDEEYYDALLRLSGEREITAVICDPSAASFITLIRRRGKYHVVGAKNDVSAGIRNVSSALKQGNLYFSPKCADAIREFGLYRWEEGGGDVPRKEDDHAMDDIRYFVSSVMDKEEPEDTAGMVFAVERR